MEEIPRRVVMIPAPFEGHLPSMMDLASNLSSNGFSITIIQTQYNFNDISSHFPEFEFLTIADGLSESVRSSLGLVDLILKLNSLCETPLKKLLIARDDVVCVIHDEFVYFPRPVAEDLKLPKMVYSASSAVTSIARRVLMDLVANGLLPQQDAPRQAEIIPGFNPFRFRDLPATQYGSMERLMELYENVSNRYTSSGIIHNTSDALEPSFIERARTEWPGVSVYHVGPLYRTPSARPVPHLFAEDRSCIEWLNTKEPDSVIYVSMGSLAKTRAEDAVEMALGLVQSEQPFLWVIRPGSITGLESMDSFPEAFREAIGERRGYVVEWAPQREVLAHGSVGGFWSHCGWNSTLESVCCGVPMICRPYSGDQRVNTRLVSHVLGTAFEVEGEMERGVVEGAVRNLMVEQEGQEMKNRAMILKGEVEASVGEGGSSRNSLNGLVSFIRSLPRHVQAE